MTTATPAQMTVTDLFGNTITVTELDKAIAERQDCVDANITVKVAPFQLVNGVESTIAERAHERVPMADYHAHLLAQLQTLKAQQAA